MIFGNFSAGISSFGGQIFLAARKKRGYFHFIGNIEASGISAGAAKDEEA